MISLAQLLEKPGYTLSSMEQSESQNKKRRSMALHFLQGEGHEEENQGMPFLDNSRTSSLPLINLEQVNKLDSSLNLLEMFLHGIDQTPSANFLDFRLHPMCSPVIQEIAGSSGDSDLNIPLSSPGCHMSVSTSRDYHSSPELAASSTYVYSPAISSICIDLDSRLKPVGIDVNISPTKIPDNEMPKDREQDRPFCGSRAKRCLLATISDVGTWFLCDAGSMDYICKTILVHFLMSKS